MTERSEKLKDFTKNYIESMKTRYTVTSYEISLRYHELTPRKHISSSQEKQVKGTSVTIGKILTEFTDTMPDKIQKISRRRYMVCP